MLNDVSQVLNENGDIFVFGVDISTKILGFVQKNPYYILIDPATLGPKQGFFIQFFKKKTKIAQNYSSLTKGNPQRVFQPTKLVFNIRSPVDGTMLEIQKFRNIFSGKYATIAVTFDKKLIAWGLIFFKHFKITIFDNFCCFFEKKSGWNPLNMLGVDNYDPLISPAEQFVFPPQFVTKLPNIDDIKQISISERHTIWLKKDNTVWGIGSNENGELSQNDPAVFFSTTPVQLKFDASSIEEECFKNGTCLIEFIHAGIESTYVGVHVKNQEIFVPVSSKPSSPIQFEPICFGVSHLDLGACKGNGMCIKFEIFFTFFFN